MYFFGFFIKFRHSYPFGSVRFIPTHVGNTHSTRWKRHGLPVLPHACGEHHIPAAIIHSDSGSSPRMWGTQHRRYQFGVLARFIPTHVGNTTPEVKPRGHRTVHPHACGEHPFHLPTVHCFFGTSPRMWGTP